ncbi:MAG TPA: hypothetical protein HPP94_08235 [Desulfuromonadales bacterium]|nr:hypothetical protein [Desulfuromonadales bacterium]
MIHVRIIDKLPVIYSHFLPLFFSNLIPVETSATCMDCVMLAKAESQSNSPKFFSAETKCCTHYPELPNYLVGALLGDADHGHETGRRRVRDKIAARTSITPLGVLRPKKYNLLIKNTAHEYFGRSITLRCPFYEHTSGSCTIAPHWDAVCSTWFCKHDAGEDGKKFWRTLRKYLENLEKILTRYALLKVGANPLVAGLSIDEAVPLSIQELDELPPLPDLYDRVWGEWVGREEEFYRECYSQISQLRQEDFANLEGIEQKILLKELEKAYEQLMDKPLPVLLKKNPGLLVEKISDSEYLLSSYSPFDPSKVSKRLYDCLDFFDGAHMTANVCKRCHEKLNVRLTEKTIKKLYQFRILVPVEGR